MEPQNVRTNSPGKSQAVHELAAALNENRFEHVLEQGNNMLAQNAGDFDVLMITAMAHIKLGNASEAVRLLESATLQLDHPEIGLARMQLARVLTACGQAERGLAICAMVAMGAPDDPKAWEEFGNMCQNTGLHLAALGAVEHTIQLQPNSFERRFNYANTLASLERHQLAVENYDAAISITPTADSYYNKANSLRSLDRNVEAVEAYDKAIDLRQEFIGALNNKALALLDMERLDACNETLDLALKYEPDNPEVMRNKANALFYSGVWKAGWQMYDNRRRIEPFSSLPSFGLADLEGQAPDKKKILIQWEHAFGDIIQMLRFVRELEARAEACCWQVAEPLHALMQHSFPDSQVIPLSQEPTNCTHRMLFTSLPLVLEIFDTSKIPGRNGYLKANPEEVTIWQDRLPKKPRVGIAWRGGAIPANRSIEIEQLEPLFCMSELCFTPLQPDILEHEKRFLAQHETVLDFSDQLISFEDTAAAIEAVDIVVTIDTATTHLAGALGKPTLIMLRKGSDWRWQLERDDCDWYDSVRLFRQDEIKNWTPVIERVKQQLVSELIK